MEITKINFIDVADIKTHVGDQKQIGISIRLLEPPHGHILFLFNGSSAKELARGMVGDMGETDPERQRVHRHGALRHPGSATS